MAAMLIVLFALSTDFDFFLQLTFVTTSTKKHGGQNGDNETLDLIRWTSYSLGEANVVSAGHRGPDETSPGDDAAVPSIFCGSATIVIQLNGEMGNHLSKIAFGYMVKWILEDDYNITSSIVLRHQDSEKWVRAMKSMMCFKKFRHLDFSQGNTQEFEDRWKQQHKWLAGDQFDIKTAASLRQNLKKLVQVFSNATNSPPLLPVDANITIPFIYANAFGVGGGIVDPFFHRLQDLFEYDLNNPECCGPRALANESVFHARGFEVELQRIAKKRGFEELSPNKIVMELLRNHQRGEKIAVVSRFPSFGQLYVDRMLSEGLDARLVETSNGEQSFCFLMSGQHEIIGGIKSTFMRWASYLGNASKARIYSLRSPDRPSPINAANITATHILSSSNFANPALRGKTFLLESYNSEEQDEIDQGRPQELQR